MKLNKSIENCYDDLDFIREICSSDISMEEIELNLEENKKAENVGISNSINLENNCNINIEDDVKFSNELNTTVNDENNATIFSNTNTNDVIKNQNSVKNEMSRNLNKTSNLNLSDSNPKFSVIRNFKPEKHFLISVKIHYIDIKSGKEEYIESPKAEQNIKDFDEIQTEKNNFSDRNDSISHNEDVRFYKTIKVNSEKDEKITSISEAQDIIEEARDCEYNAMNSNPKPSKRFVLTQSYGIININDAKDFGDFEKRDLFDKCKKKCSSGKYNSAWIKVNHNILFCFRNKKVIKDRNFTMSKYVFVDPEDTRYYHEIKYQIDLSESKIMLTTENNPGSSNIFCCIKNIDTNSLIDISNMSVKSLMESNKKFNVILIDENQNSKAMTIHKLYLILHYNGDFYPFWMESIDSFLKWITVFQLRRNQKIFTLN